MTSNALWVALIWIFIVGSRNVSSWFGGGTDVENIGDYIQGSPFDRNVYLVLILLGTFILLQRRIDWSDIFRTNKWLFILTIYFGISIIWSDYPFVSFKRWIKEIGNIVMVLIICTDTKPAKAFYAVFYRYISIVIPFSVVLIKYFPNLGRYYNKWTWEYAYGGITTSKNELGLILCIAGLIIISEVFYTRKSEKIKNGIYDRLNKYALFIMLLWLLSLAKSSTSIVCFILGTAILFCLRKQWGRNQVHHLGMYSLFFGIVLFIFYLNPNILGAIVGLFGRDITFTGRTNLWIDLLVEQNNPILGSGYASFWLGSGAERIWAKYYFHPTQAHNGFLQTYLDGGIIGLILLVGMLVSTGKKLKIYVLESNKYGTFLFTILVIAIFYNWTEAMFSGLSLLWIAVLIGALNKYPKAVS